ncbi:MAG: L,D-transpeptidase family protein [Clostridia bacterium]|nr:L,D-transpeptidase family protein [Clostridia bacterium]
MKRRITAGLLALVLMLLCPMGAMAAKKAGIRFPVKVGLMFEGASVTLKPKVTGVSRALLSWESSDASVLEMQGNTATAKAPGRAVITASGGGATARCGVVVLPRSLSLTVGDKVSLPRGGVEKYAMKNKRVATVSKKGLVRAVKPGKTKLTVKYGAQKLTLAVTVSKPEAQTGSAAAGLEAAGESDQIVLVERTKGSSATLTVHEKRDGVWVQLYTCAAYVGKNGIDKVKEGDKRTPTGTFNLTTPFGIKADPGAQMPYTKVTKYHYWCGDSKSSYYNQLVDERTADRKHTSSDEYLINYKGVYNYCLFIDYNAEGTPGKGSCIFLHCTGKNKYTAGCVAVSEAAMKKIIRWVKPGAKIVIRQQPAA